ncbi:MAG TPA: pitrilysin family protein [Dehalococcoidia bacterium]|nr:pitrilysin family protein [Dehalococcoidia bacterium]
MALIETLDNGLRLVATSVPQARSVSISFYLAAGSRYESAADAGLSHFIEHLCFKGTNRRPLPQDIAIEIDRMGSTINAVTDRELTVYYAKVVPEHAGQAFDVLADMLRDSLFREPEIERERGVILEELAATEDSPAEQVGLLLDRLLWAEQPLGRDIAGSPQTVTAITPERLTQYYRDQYVADSVVVSVAGAIDERETADLIRRTLGDWSSGGPADWLREESRLRGERVGTIEKETEQVHISFGTRGLSYRDEDRYPLDVLSVLLGEGMSSRLFARLREELGLCYDIHTYVSHLRDTGMFGLYAGVDPGNAREAVAEIAAELRRVREPVSSEELDRAKGLIRSRVQLRFEDTRAVSAWHGSQEILDLPRLTPEEAIAQTEAVTIEDIERVAARVINDDALHIALVGPIDGAEITAGVSIDG